MFVFALFCIPTAIYLVVARKSADAPTVMGLRLPSGPGWAWSAALVAVGLGLGWLGTRAVPADVLHGAGTTGTITSAVAAVAVVFRAVGEEVFFRGFLQGLAARHWGAWWGIGLSAVAFLLPHLFLLAVSTALAPLVAAQFVIGLALAWIRQRTASIWPGALAHVLTNLATGLLPL